LFVLQAADLLAEADLLDVAGVAGVASLVFGSSRRHARAGAERPRESGNAKPITLNVQRKRRIMLGVEMRCRRCSKPPPHQLHPIPLRFYLVHVLMANRLRRHACGEWPCGIFPPRKEQEDPEEGGRNPCAP